MKPTRSLKLQLHVCVGYCVSLPLGLEEPGNISRSLRDGCARNHFWGSV